MRFDVFVLCMDNLELLKCIFAREIRKPKSTLLCKNSVVQHLNSIFNTENSFIILCKFIHLKLANSSLHADDFSTAIMFVNSVKLTPFIITFMTFSIYIEKYLGYFLDTPITTLGLPPQNVQFYADSHLITIYFMCYGLQQFF